MYQQQISIQRYLDTASCSMALSKNLAITVSHNFNLSSSTQRGTKTSLKCLSRKQDVSLIPRMRQVETSREDSLFTDSFASIVTEALQPLSCESNDSAIDSKSSGFFVVSTRHIDDLLILDAHDLSREVRQVILLTDGTDCRPYRLPWPAGTRLFDVSVGHVYNVVADKLKSVEARIPKGCLLRHVSADVAQGDDWRDEGWGEKLVRMGYRGDLPSLWLIQGIENLNKEGLQGVLGHVAIMAMEKSNIFGEIPFSAVEIDPLTLKGMTLEEVIETLRNTTSLIFAKNGFLVEILSYHDVGLNLKKWSSENLPTVDDFVSYGKIFFSATQCKLSEAQVNQFQYEVAVAESFGDEAGFEDMP